MPLGPISPPGAAAKPRRVSFRIPLLDWLSQYRGDWLRPDVLAGLTTAAVVIPKAMAYATVAGLPVTVGCTPPSPMAVYALLSTSQVERELDHHAGHSGRQRARAGFRG